MQACNLSISNSSTILLAAGASSRMGFPKGLLSYLDRPWILEQLDRLNHCGVKDVVVVLGRDAKQYFTRVPLLYHALKQTTEHLNLQARVVINKQPEHGTFSSIHAALHFRAKNPLSARIPPAFILPIDVPAPPVEIWHCLLRAYSEYENTKVVVPTFLHQRGHPVLISPLFQDHLLKIPLNSEYARLDFQIRFASLEREEGTVREIEVYDPQIRLNLNTPQDWEKFTAQHRN